MLIDYHRKLWTNLLDGSSILLEIFLCAKKQKIRKCETFHIFDGDFVFF